MNVEDCDHVWMYTVVGKTDPKSLADATWRCARCKRVKTLFPSYLGVDRGWVNLLIEWLRHELIEILRELVHRVGF